MPESESLPFLHPDRVGVPYRGKALGPEGALAEMAGRDSVGAVVVLAREGGLERVLPAITYTGTEYGGLGSLHSNTAWLRSLLHPLGVEVMEPVVIGSPLWWGATIGRVNSVLARRYGPWHICIGCHMYLHAVRVPLAWRAGAERLVAGERLGHGGRIKINQIRPAVEAYRRVLGEWGMKLEMPLLEVDEDADIVALTGDWEEGGRQPGCVLSGNYREIGGEPVFDPERVRAYLEEYLVPATSHILAALRDGGRVDYTAVVEEVLG